MIYVILTDTTKKQYSFSKALTSRERIKDIVNDFVPFVKKQLGCTSNPVIKFVDVAKAEEIKAFGQHHDKTRTILVEIKNRQPMDILRTVVHEFVHEKQRQDGNDGTSEAGSKIENEANAKAGEILRLYAKKHADFFK